MSLLSLCNPSPRLTRIVFRLTFTHTFTVATSNGIIMDAIVTNLPKVVDDQQLATLFGGLEVDSANVIRNRTGESRGFGFVRFKSPQQLQQAIAMTTSVVQDITLHVTDAQQYKQRGRQLSTQTPGGRSGRGDFSGPPSNVFAGRGRGRGRGDGRGFVGTRGPGRGSGRKTLSQAPPPTDAQRSQLIRTQQKGMGIYLSELDNFMKTMKVGFPWFLKAATDERTQAGHIWNGTEELDVSPWQNNWLLLLNLNLPYIVSVFDPSPDEKKAIELLPTLKFHRGMSISVYEFSEFPRLRNVDGTPCVDNYVPRMHPVVKKDFKRMLMKPYFDFRAQTAPEFGHKFGDEVFFAQNAVMSAVHCNEQTNKAHLFLVWAADKNNGEWCMPGGKVDQLDKSLEHTAAREWTEEVIGFPYEDMAIKDSPMEMHTVRKEESIKYPVDTHLFIRASDDFFERTAAGRSKVGKLPVETVENPIRWNPEPSQEIQENYFKGVGNPIEHEYYTWVSIDLKWNNSTGFVKDVYFELAANTTPENNGLGKLRRETTDFQFRSGITKFLNTIVKPRGPKSAYTKHSKVTPTNPTTTSTSTTATTPSSTSSTPSVSKPPTTATVSTSTTTTTTTTKAPTPTPAPSKEPDSKTEKPESKTEEPESKTEEKAESKASAEK
eukprot:m.81487 g.81487  ORF g.81487 m.81487 type:complete len:661 (-) comp25424_c0_seq2:126-2108(-)